MSAVTDILLGKDIVLDQEAFTQASSKLHDLAEKLQTLRNDVENMLKEIKQGFDTPAGRKFINSCEANLIKPLEDQKVVIDHVADTLNECMDKYKSVFEGYRELNKKINSYKN